MRRIARGFLSLAVATAAGVSVAAPASAATAPPVWQVGGSSYGAPDNLGDPSNVGTLSFFDSSGNRITTGSAAAGFSYVEVDGLPAGDLNGDRAFVVLYAATPQPATPAGSFPSKAISVKTPWPNAAAPGALATDANPLFSGPLATKQDDSLDTYAKSFPQTATASGYAGVFEVRAFLTGADGIETDYASADLQVDSATDTWSQIFPSVTVTTPPSSPVGTTTSVTVSPGSGISGSSQTLAATVSAVSGTVSPAGTVDFTDGANDLGSKPLSGSGGAASASLSTTALGAGPHTIKATFTPTDPTAFSTSNGSAATFSLTAPAANAIATTTTLQVDPGAGQALSAETLTATVTAASGSAFPPGTVDFTDSGTDLGIQQVGAGGSAAAGTATLQLTLHGGAHAISASYTPSDVNAFVPSTTASAQSFQLSAIPTSTSLQSSAQTITGPGTVDFTATVTPSTAVGSVSFVPTINGVEDDQQVSVVTISGGQAVLHAVLSSPATYSIAASFSPTTAGDYTSSVSTPSTVQENPPAPTSTVLATSASTMNFTDTVTFTATTAPVAGGVVDFNADGTKDLGTFAAVGGVATVTVSASTLGAGAHTIAAVFGSVDPGFADSVSNPVTVTVNAPALGGGGAVTLSSPVAAVGPSLVGPKQIGQVEQVVSGTWSGSPSPTFSYQWLRDGKAIKGATSSTYTLTSADYKHHISAQVVAANAAGSVVTTTSSVLPKVGNKPTVKNLKLKGSVVHGKKVQVAIGTWSVGKLTYSYQWKLNGKAVKGATRSSFTLPTSARHETLTLVVTAKESGYTTAVVSTKSVRVG